MLLTRGNAGYLTISLQIFDSKLLRMFWILPNIAPHQVEVVFHNCVLFSQGLREPASLTLSAC